VEEPARPVTLQGLAHPGPENSTIALAGLKPLPFTAKVKGRLFTAGFGNVVMPLNFAASPVSLCTRIVRVFEAPESGPFVTVTLKVPDGRTVAPFSCPEDPPRLPTTQGESHPGPEKTAVAVEGLNPLPSIVNANGCPLTGGFGEVLTLSRIGVPAVLPAIVKETPFDGVHSVPHRNQVSAA
jgi:hypothetical protein